MVGTESDHYPLGGTWGISPLRKLEVALWPELLSVTLNLNHQIIYLNYLYLELVW